MVLLARLLFLAAPALFIVPVPAAGQATLAPPSSADASQIAPSPDASPDSTATSNLPDDRSASAGTLNLSATSLSADQIIDLLERNPDLAVEVKSLAADRLAQQGAQIDANDISDQMLYNQVAGNAGFRSAITLFLRARGYITDDDLQLAPAVTAAAHAAPGSNTSQQPFDAPAGLDSSFPGATPAATQGINRPVINPSPAARPAEEENRKAEKTNSSTDEPQVLHRPAPYNLRSMRDLYTQIPGDSVPLKRFASQVFLKRDLPAATRGIRGQDTSLDVPLGPDYVLGPGDTLQISVWGSVTQAISRIVGRDGRILLPEAGSLEVAGLDLDHAAAQIEGALKIQYRNAKVTVTVSSLRSVRVYVVGDVQRPGGYDISSLATPLSALYAAGGPTSVGSLRIVRHLRGQNVIEETDLYDFLLHGVRNGSVRFESGDTLLVPPAGPQVAISGAIKRPAIYELKAGETTLSSLIDDAGGLTAAASLSHVTVDRIDANRRRETVTLPAATDQNQQLQLAAIRDFAVKDGDRIRIDPILPYSEQAVYLEGHVARPGRIAFTDGMRLSDVLRSYRDLLPEPAAHGEIVRLVAPDLHAETIEFNVPEVLIGNANADLQPFDTVRVFSRYEADAPRVTIRGEVLRPGSYPLSAGMTAAQLVRMAGGFKRDALRETADLTSYEVGGNNRVQELLTPIRIGAAVSGSDAGADLALKAGDVLSVHQITGWNDIGESVIVEGQVRFPGSYGFTEGERLSSVLRRAGGLLDTAYPAGAVLIRDQVRELEKKSREELIRQIETNSAAARLSPNLGGSDTGATLQLIKAQQDQVIADLKNHPPTGRMVIHIAADIDSWANTPADIELRQGDTLTIPKRPGFVLVSGQVYNATALAYTPGKTAGWYLSRAGGTNSTANRREVFIIRANGSVVGRRSTGWFEGDVLSTRLDPGDVVVVPQKIVGASLFWRNLLTTAQLASSIAITAAVAAL